METQAPVGEALRAAELHDLGEALNALAALRALIMRTLSRRRASHPAPPAPRESAIESTVEKG